MKFRICGELICFMCIVNRILYIIFLCLFAFDSFSQEFSYFAQMSSIFSKGDYAPFWLTANRQGLSSVEKNNGYARFGLLLEGQLGKSAFNYKTIVDAVAGYNRETTVMLHQACADVSWRWLNLSLGQKERYGEMSAFSVISILAENKVAKRFSGLFVRRLQELGSGGLLYSGNSRPIPQVRFEIPDYVSFPRTKDWLKVKGHIAYGAFLDGGFQEDFTYGNPYTRYVKNLLYHSKALFLKVGKPEKFPLTIEGGLEMYTQFGGDIYVHGAGKTLSMPRGVSDFFKAFVPLSGSDDTPDTEQTNISGNQLGNWHLAITLHTSPVDVRFYGQHFFEDFSQLFFFEYQSDREGDRNIIYYPWKDIMLGVNITNKTSFFPFVSNVCYEYLSTYNQSGAGYNDPGPIFKEQMDGLDNYYNHGIYSGWHNYGMGIGNPLVFSPVYNRNGDMRFAGNRLVAHNAGVNGAFGKKHVFAYKLQYTYSENWGTYINPFSEKKYTTSLLADVCYAPAGKSWAATLSVAYDKSNWLGENMGFMLSLTKIGLFK